MVCRPFCYKTCTRILRVQPRLQMGQVSIIENSFPQERSQKLKSHYIAPGLCYAVKKWMFCENFLYYIVSWWNNYFKLWLRKEQFFVVEKWHFVQNRFLLFVSLLSSFFIFFFHTDKNDYYHQQLTSSGIHMNEQERERHIKQNKICEGCFSHVQTLTSLVRWLNKFFSFNASLVWV